jgi:hypothetical protein
VGLVVQAPQTLHDRFLYLVEPFGRLAGLGVDLQDRVVVKLNLEIARPAAVTAQPGRAVPVELAHLLLCSGSGGSPCAYFGQRITSSS